jgi:hypothetical protein
MSLRDIMLHDQTLTMHRILLHIRQEYSISLTKQQIEVILEDARQLVLKVNEKVLEP